MNTVKLIEYKTWIYPLECQLQRIEKALVSINLKADIGHPSSIVTVTVNEHSGVSPPMQLATGCSSVSSPTVKKGSNLLLPCDGDVDDGTGDGNGTMCAYMYLLNSSLIATSYCIVLVGVFCRYM